MREWKLVLPLATRCQLRLTVAKAALLMTSSALPERAGSRLLWTYVPLVAFVVLSLPLLSMLLFAPVADWEQRDLTYYATFLFICFGPNWPFVALYVGTIRAAKKEFPSVGSVRTAMWFSLAAMLIPIGLVWLLFLTADYSVRGMAEGMAFILIYTLLGFVVLLPILGLIGWFTGRWIYRKNLPSAHWSETEIMSRLKRRPVIWLALLAAGALIFGVAFKGSNYLEGSLVLIALLVLIGIPIFALRLLNQRRT